MGGGGGGKGGDSGPSIDPNAASDVYQRWYTRGQQGSIFNPEGENLPPQYGEYAAQGYQMGRQDYQNQQALQNMSSMFAMPEMPTYEGPTYEEQLAEQKKQQGIYNRDQLFSQYMDAASAAADYVTGEISDEMANARLLGIEYDITDEQKQQRINNYFASIWGEGQQSELENLMSEYGNPKGFEGWTITRGDPSSYANQGTEGEEITAGATTGLKPKPSLLSTEEDVLGASKSILGA